MTVESGPERSNISQKLSKIHIRKPRMSSKERLINLSLILKNKSRTKKNRLERLRNKSKR